MEKYTLKQIIFALREVYLENEKQLEELKKYITIKTDQKLDKFDFYSYSSNNKKVLELELREQQGFIIRFLEQLSDLELYKQPIKTIEIAHELNGEKKYIKMPISDIYEINDHNRLYNYAHRVLDSRFAKNINIPEFIFNDINFECNTTGIRTNINSKNGIKPGSIIYNSKKDIITLQPELFDLYYNNVIDLFNSEVPVDNFSDYHREIIEGSQDNHKRLLIDGLDSYSTKEQNFDIRVDEDDIISSKKQK